MPEVEGIHYQVYRRGSRKPLPVVLVHGAGGNLLSWPPEVRRLPDFPIYALDLPGHGASPGQGEQSIPNYARRLLAWLEALLPAGAVVVGHSMGGAIAQVLAIHHPEMVRGLVLVGTGARLRVNPALLEMAADPSRFSRVVEQITTWSFSRASDPRLRELVGERMRAGDPRVLHGDFSACDTFDVRPHLGQIRAPTLVICGEDDKMTPLHLSRELAEKIGGARLSLVPRAGHMVMLEQAPTVSTTIHAFLETLSP